MWYFCQRPPCSVFFLILEINHSSPNLISPPVSALEPSPCWDKSQHMCLFCFSFKWPRAEPGKRAGGEKKQTKNQNVLHYKSRKCLIVSRLSSVGSGYKQICHIEFFEFFSLRVWSMIVTVWFENVLTPTVSTSPFKSAIVPTKGTVQRNRYNVTSKADNKQSFQKEKIHYFSHFKCEIQSKDVIFTLLYFHSKTPGQGDCVAHEDLSHFKVMTYRYFGFRWLCNHRSDLG